MNVNVKYCLPYECNYNMLKGSHFLAHTKEISVEKQRQQRPSFRGTSKCHSFTPFTPLRWTLVSLTDSKFTPKSCEPLCGSAHLEGKRQGGLYADQKEERSPLHLTNTDLYVKDNELVLQSKLKHCLLYECIRQSHTVVLLIGGRYPLLLA